MKFEAGVLNLVIKPENDGDAYNLGVMSTKFKCQTQFISEKNTDDPETKIECKALLVKYEDIIDFLTSANKK